jgi:hypothetical protein
MQPFDKHCSCHLQDEHVMDGHFWKPYFGQARWRVGFTVLIDEAEQHIYPEDGNWNFCRNFG